MASKTAVVSVLAMLMQVPVWLVCAPLFAVSASPSLAEFKVARPQSAFEENQGQFASAVRYAVRAPQLAVGIRPDGLSFSVPGSHASGVFFIGSRRRARVSAEEPTGERTHYLNGSGVAGRIELTRYSRVRVIGLYRGIDWTIYFRDGKIEHDWIIRPGSDPRLIRIRLNGFDSASVDGAGDLFLGVPGGRIVWRSPAAYQSIAGRRRPVHVRYRITAGELTMAVDREYNSKLSLIIDPVVTFVHNVSGSDDDRVEAIRVDPSGFIYIAGATRSPDFEITPGAAVSIRSPNEFQVFVRKLSQDGSKIVYSTYLGVVTRTTLEQRVVAMAVDAAGNAYVASNAFNQPTTASAIDNRGTVSLVKLATSGDRVVYATRLIQNPNYLFNMALAVDSGGAAYVGFAGFNFASVTKVDPTGQRQDYVHTIDTGIFGFVGLQAPIGITLGADRSVYLTGGATNPAFPITPGAYHAVSATGRNGDTFLVHIDATGRETLLSTLLGGEHIDRGNSVAVDTQGNIYVAGLTVLAANTIPMSGQTLQGLPRREGSSGFIVKLNPSGTQALYEIILPNGSADAIAVDAAGNAYVAGTSDDGFTITKLDASGTHVLFHSSVPATGPAIAGLAIATTSAAWLGGSALSFKFPDPDAVSRGWADGFVAAVSTTPAVADLELRVETTPARDAVPGDDIVYALSIRNDGPETATTVVVHADEYRDLTFSACRGSANATCSTDLRSPRIFIPSIAAGSTERVELRRPLTRVPSNGALIPFSAQAASSSAETNLANNFARLDKPVRYVVLTIFNNVNASYRIDNSPVLRAGVGPGALYFPPNSTVTIGFPSPQIVQGETVIFRRWLDGSTDNPRTFALGSTDQTGSAVFDRTNIPFVRSDSIVNAASFRSGAFSAGEIVTLFGFNLGPPALVRGQFDEQKRLRTDVAGVRILFDGVPAPIVYVSSTQSSAIVPYSVAGKTSARVLIEYGANTSDGVDVVVAPASPALFTSDASGVRQAAAMNEDGSLNSSQKPAARGGIVVLYGTGEGATDPQSPDGGLIGQPPPKIRLPVFVTVDGASAEVLYSGAVPGQVAGLFQLNIRLPESIQPGTQVPVTVSIGGVTSPSGPTLAIR